DSIDIVPWLITPFATRSSNSATRLVRLRSDPTRSRSCLDPWSIASRTGNWKVFIYYDGIGTRIIGIRADDQLVVRIDDSRLKQCPSFVDTSVIQSRNRS